LSFKENLMDKSDQIRDLLIEVSKGDTDSFRLFYDTFFKKVLQFSHYFVHSDEVCEEIVSEVFTNIWLNKEKLSDIENIESYLFIITRNLAFNYREKESRIPELSNDLSLNNSTEDSNPENILIAKELESVIQDSINQLPERCRIIFLMSRDEKLTHQKIAEILSISENTVHAQMMTAIKKLHNVLRKYISMIV
jgi:RNA polymerase sigma-70 factor (ECF subfamily)